MNSSRRATERQRILQRLLADSGGWVPLPHVQACAAQYNTRLYELRRLGFRITNRTREVSGQRHSWFRMEPAETIVSRCEHENVAPATGRSFPGFGILDKEAGYPD
jgi:hypothetical protein